jgi:putative ABC transport system permease protein
MKAPLAWLQLIHNKPRLLVALAGIGFADLLMFLQLGFQAALFESNVKLHNSFQGDLFLISPQSNASVTMKPFSRRRIYQALGVEGVESATSVSMDFAIWKNPENGQSRGLLVFGLNPDSNPLDLPNLSENIEVIKRQDTYLFDDLSRPEFGSIPAVLNQGQTVTAEMDEQQITIGGLFSLGASFAADGNVITSDINFHHLFPHRNQGLIDIGVIQLNPTAHFESVQKTLKNHLPPDVLILSKAEFVAWEKQYWQTSTAIGFIFSLGVGIGFIVGVLIVYQILYTDVSDHLPEYATLKAMGYRNHYFIGVIFQEAVLLGCLGYLPGVSVTMLLYSLAAQATNLPILMTLSRAVLVLVLTLIMCIISGLISVRRLNAADPADIF